MFIRKYYKKNRPHTGENAATRQQMDEYPEL